MDYLQYLNVSFTHHPENKGLLLHELSLNSVGCEDHNPCIPRIITILDHSLTTKLDHLSTSNMILDPMFPAKEPCPHHQSKGILVRLFGVPAQIIATSWNASRVTTSELLRMYSINLPHTPLHRTV